VRDLCGLHRVARSVVVVGNLCEVSCPREKGQTLGQAAGASLEYLRVHPRYVAFIIHDVFVRQTRTTYVVKFYLEAS